MLVCKYLFYITILLATSIPLEGQNTFQAELLGVKQGLSQATNSFIYNDKSGFVWISSIDGLNRFNGRSVEVFKPIRGDTNSIKGSNIQSPFFEDFAHNIWFGTESGLNCYLFRQNKFKSYRLNPKDSSEHTHNYPFFLEKNRFLWTTVDSNLYKIDTWYPELPAHLILRGCEDFTRCSVDTFKNGCVQNIYVAFWDNKPGFEVISFDENANLLSRKHFLVNNIFEKKCKIVQITPNGNHLIWLCSSLGLIQFNLNNTNNYQVFKNNLEVSQSIQHCIHLSKDQLLVSGASGAIYCFDKQRLKFSNCSNQNIDKIGIAPCITNNLYLSKEQHIWWGVQSEGVYFSPKDPPFQFTKFPKGGIREPIKQIFEFSKTETWLIGKNNYYVLKNNNYQHVAKKSCFPYAKILRDHRGRIWSFSIKGLHLLNTLNYSWKLVAQLEESRSFMDAIIPRDNLLLVGTLEGIFKVDLSDFSIEKLSDQVAYSLTVDKKGQIWQGADNFIQVWDINAQQKIVPKTKLQNTNDVNYLYHSGASNQMWAGTSRGLLVIDINNFQVDVIDEQDGLQNQYIYAIQQDRNYRLWLSTNQGIIYFYSNQKPYLFKQFTMDDGLSSNEFNIAAALQDSRGYLWFGSTKGIDVFHPDSIQNLGHAPQLAIVGLKIHDQEWHGDTAIEVVQRIQLPYNQNTLRLELAAMEYLDPERNKFKVLLQLDNEQPTWTDLGTQNFVTYANLKPGKYTFRFIACNAEGIWNDEKDARVLYIDIAPHWSDTWWFRTLLGVLILGFVSVATALYYRYQLRAQQLQNEKIQREAERQRMELEKNVALADGQRKVAESEMKLLRSQLNPHFLFNAMNSINRYILSNEKEKASEYLGQFAQLTRSILDNSRNRTIALADELKMLHHYLSLENHRFRQQINWTFTISPDLDEDEVQVPSMLLQPFAENAILHGLAPKGGGHIAVEISEHENRLQCIIRDDGVGRQIRTPLPTDEKPKHASVGMRLISEQLDAFAGLEGQSASIAVNDLKDTEGNPTGTEVIIILPLVYNV